ncbi:replication-associated recombination protein A [Aliiglaciecola sp. LCG003]|uniref:replication-associated recombination protein A n=1 Tax=Aliiglaciecola sp. LCG003 TaxID=3053655 RepID=UPI0025733BF0|nr:replication-associated recombination protein A [Aliiglaciecola sp. LCG003]WJG11171.1 replication-associated recombination protein A [Aliiglaciecola sp. LCG003]
MGFDFDDQDQFKPLAARMRPQHVAQYFGQQHIVGPGKPLRKALEHGQCHSMILWGPPGTGKTTLAEMIAKHCDAHIERISAVTSGVKDIRSAIEVAKQQSAMRGKRTILFVDEVHRFNKSQQDAFLPFIEDGTITFIGATTENPSFELNNALLSRARVYVLQPLSIEELEQVLDNALGDHQNGLGEAGIKLEPAARHRLLELASGDARRLLNYLELSADFATEATISLETVAIAIGNKVTQFDKGGDQFYDMLSAFHKSVRGSSADGALYWYARMLTAGADPLTIARRLLAIATEDIGNADPRAMQVCLNAWDIFQRVGASEGERAIAQATIYCACAAKSNAVYKAFNAAKADAKDLPDYPVPNHLRNAPTELMSKLGYGEGYRYAHNEPNAYAAGERYLPSEMEGKVYYEPVERGVEKQIRAKLDYLKGLDQNSTNRRAKNEQ